MNNLFNRNKTFRPKKNHSHGTKRYDLHKRAQATLGKCVRPASRNTLAASLSSDTLAASLSSDPLVGFMYVCVVAICGMQWRCQKAKTRTSGSQCTVRLCPSILYIETMLAITLD